MLPKMLPEDVKTEINRLGVVVLVECSVGIENRRLVNMLIRTEREEFRVLTAIGDDRGCYLLSDRASGGFGWSYTPTRDEIEAAVEFRRLNEDMRRDGGWSRDFAKPSPI